MLTLVEAKRIVSTTAMWEVHIHLFSRDNNPDASQSPSGVTMRQGKVQVFIKRAGDLYVSEEEARDMTKFGIGPKE